MITGLLRTLAIAGTLASATAAGAYPYVQTPVQSLADHEINRMIVGGHGSGYDRLVFAHRDQMETGGREVTFVVLLQAGENYRLAARCGSDCVNLNLSLRDAAGREVAADRSNSELAGFDVRAPYNGAYVVTLELTSCRTPRCNVGAVVLGRSAPSPDA
jgi:hypothetical protein